MIILLLIKYKYISCFYLMHEEPCNVDVANKPLLLVAVVVVVLLLLLLLYVHCNFKVTIKKRSISV